MLYNDSSNADGAILTSSTLDSLKSQLAQKQADLSYWQQKAAEYQSNFNRRYNCGGLKQPCNNWLDRRNEANANAANVQSAINSLTTQIEKELQNLQAQQAAKIAADQAAAKAKVATDPTLAKIQAEKEIAEKEAATKRLYAIGIILVVLLIAGGLTWWFIKRRKG
jgi:predicted  nucleic acid-binding Zn-ribbon protein